MKAGNTIFLVSDRTGITVEGLVRTLLTQFESVSAERVVRPFSDTGEKMDRVINEIDSAADSNGAAPIVFSSIVDPVLRERLKASRGRVLDLFEAFLPPLSEALDLTTSARIGQTHGMGDIGDYDRRVEAVNFALSFDDGARLKGLEAAQIILVGVSRSGKTPTCLYLAMQYKILAANYPLIEEDFLHGHLPKPLQPFRERLFGLNISPERLHQIREERRPGSGYASLSRCRADISAAENVFAVAGIPHVDSTRLSIEELAVEILHRARLNRLS